MKYVYPSSAVCTLLLCLRLFLGIAFSCIPTTLPWLSGVLHFLALTLPVLPVCLSPVRRLCSQDVLRCTCGTERRAKRAPARSNPAVVGVLFSLFGLGVLALSELIGIAVGEAGYTVDVGSIPLWEGLLCYVVLPPIGEELFFRFAILGCFFADAPLGGVLVSSLLFALSHGGLWQFPYTFFAGILLGVTAIGCKSILPGIMFHFTNNAVCFALSLLSREQAIWGMWIYSGALLLIGAVSGICLWRLHKKGEWHPYITPSSITASAFMRNLLLSPLSVYILAAFLLKLPL